MNWNIYQDVYDIYINGTKMHRVYGNKHAINVGFQQSGQLFGYKKVEVVNIHTGEVIWTN